MLYALMHKKIPVADIEIDSETASIAKILKIYNIKHVPIGVEIKDNVISRKSLNEWWIGRSIPASRSGIKEALEAMNVSSAKMLLEKCLGLGLSDHYWINNLQKPLEWLGASPIFDWINFEALKDIDEEFREIYKPSKYIDRARIDRLLYSLKKRIEMVKREVG